MSSPYVPTTWLTGDIITAVKANNWETQYDDVFDAGTKTVAGSWNWANGKTIGWADGYFDRTGANAVKLWNGTTTGTLTATLVGNVTGNLTGNVTGNVSGSAGSVAASALTGTTLASGVTASSLTSVGTLTGLTVSGAFAQSGGAVTTSTGTSTCRFTGGDASTVFAPMFAGTKTISGMTQLGEVDFAHSSTNTGQAGIAWSSDNATHSSANTKLQLFVRTAGSQAIFTIDGTSPATMTWTGAFSLGSLSLTTTLSVANGGTGATTFTANRVLLGNGTSAITTNSGLTDDGTTLTAHTNTFAAASTSLAGSLTVAADLTVNGSNNSTFTGTLNAQRQIILTNLSTGTASIATLHTVAGSSEFAINTYSQNYTTSGLNIPSSTLLVGAASGGLSIVASDAAGVIRFGTVTSEKARIHNSGGWSLGNTTDPGLGCIFASGNALFQTSATLDNYVSIVNTNTGTTAYARVYLGNNGGTVGDLVALGTGFTTSGPLVQNALLLRSSTTAGMSIQAADTSSTMRFYNGTKQNMILQPADVSYTNVAGTVVRPQILFSPAINSTGLSAIPVGVQVDYTLTTNPTGVEIRGLSIAAGTASGNSGNVGTLRAITAAAAHSGTGVVTILSNVIRSQVESGAGNVTTLLGSKIETELKGTQTVTQNGGLQVAVQSTAASTTGSVFGIVAGYSATHASAVVSGDVKIFTTTFVNSGTISGATYALYIDSCVAGTQTGAIYGIYQSDAAMLNYFGGNVTHNGFVFIPTGGSSVTPMLAFTSDADNGVYRLTTNIWGLAAGGRDTIVLYGNGSRPLVDVPSGIYATGSGATGSILSIGRNSAGNKAPGLLDLVDKNGVDWYIWVDTSGNVRVGSTAPDEASGDTIGTKIGAQ